MRKREEMSVVVVRMEGHWWRPAEIKFPQEEVNVNSHNLLNVNGLPCEVSCVEYYLGDEAWPMIWITMQAAFKRSPAPNK